MLVFPWQVKTPEEVWCAMPVQANGLVVDLLLPKSSISGSAPFEFFARLDVDRILNLQESD